MVECMLCKHKVIGSNPIISKYTYQKVKYTSIFCINIYTFLETLQAGFEPTSKWLTATCSTTELLKKILVYRYISRTSQRFKLVLIGFDIKILSTNLI